MYNYELNERCIQQLRDDVAGKRVLMVGNATTMFSKKYGDFIDSFDFVVRFGKGVPYPEYREYLGSKTDLWFFGTGRAGMYRDFPNAKYKLYTVAQLNLYRKDRPEMAVHRDMLNGKFQAYKDFFFAGDVPYTLRANRDINGDTEGARISQGAQCIHFFANRVDTYQSIDLIGFDFFGNGFTYNYDSNRPTIPKEHPTTSWHMPLISAGYDGNPHLNNGNEERYIRSVPRLTVNDMPPVDMDKMKELLHKLRGNKAKITGDLK